MDYFDDDDIEVMPSEDDNESQFVEISENVSTKIQDIDLDKEIYVLPLRNMVIFPEVYIPVNVARESTRKLIIKASKAGAPIAVFTQRDADVEEPLFEDLYHVGVVAYVRRIFDLGERGYTAVFQATTVRVSLTEITSTKPFMVGRCVHMPEQKLNRTSERKVLMDSLRERTRHYIDATFKGMNDLSVGMDALATEDDIMSNHVCTFMPFSVEEKIELLELFKYEDRARKLMQKLSRETQYSEMKKQINRETQRVLNKQQREYFLQQQIKNIQAELGTSDNEERNQLEARAAKKKWGDDIAALFKKELDKLSRIMPQSADYSVQLSYLQTLLDLPWNIYTNDNLDIKHASQVLNKDHYGLEKVKERILEYLAVLRMKGDLKAPIICLYGPPGVGKTSLGRSVAKALNRKYFRMSLGGVHDEAEIRGHRRTYVGAMPGRLVSAIIKAGSDNPVIILDEIDKLASDGRSDPASAMLEVLDPEQNNAFHDNYIDVDYDLSKVMFIATANNLSAVHPALLDRMELIEVPGYITEEKLEIARKHLIPKELANCGMNRRQVKFSKAAIERIIEDYTRESGVRELEKKINKVMRKIALGYAMHPEERPACVSVTPALVNSYLGTAEFTRDMYQGNDYAGVVTGLAWTSVGGEILFVETSVSRGVGGKLTLTGNLGDVMKESAMLALEYIKAHAHLLDIQPEVFTHWQLHVHVPEGAIPKDGPSAGITMVTSIASALTQRKVRKNLAMTGEITLRGKVLPVGGIREKILAAKRSGITDIILCSENKRHIDEIPAEYLNGVNFHYVSDIQEVLALALTDEKVPNALDFHVDETEKTADTPK